MTAVIEASSAGVKDMADGSLRITFEFEPRHAAEAFALFGPRGRAVAVAALKDGAAAIPSNSMELEQPKEREHLGDLCYRAVMWCNDAEFREWVNSKTFGGIFWHVEDANDCADFIREHFDVKSRKDLDKEPARTSFIQQIVGPWQKYQMARRSA